MFRLGIVHVFCRGCLNSLLHTSILNHFITHTSYISPPLLLRLFFVVSVFIHHLGVSVWDLWVEQRKTLK